MAGELGRISRLEADIENIKRTISEASRRTERDIDDLKKVDTDRHEENVRKMEELDASLRVMQMTLSQATGGAAVVRYLIHIAWVVAGSIGTLVGQFLFSRPPAH